MAENKLGTIPKSFIVNTLPKDKTYESKKRSELKKFINAYAKKFAIARFNGFYDKYLKD